MFDRCGIDPGAFDGDYLALRQQIHPDDRPALDAAVGGFTTPGWTCRETS